MRKNPDGSARAMVFEDREVPGQWRVEYPLPPDGEQFAIHFCTGPNAREQALEYAAKVYGSRFDEIKLHPYWRVTEPDC